MSCQRCCTRVLLHTLPVAIAVRRLATDEFDALNHQIFGLASGVCLWAIYGESQTAIPRISILYYEMVRFRISPYLWGHNECITITPCTERPLFFLGLS